MLFLRFVTDEQEYNILGVYPMQSAKDLIDSIDEHVSIPLNNVHFTIIEWGGIVLNIGKKDYSLNDREKVLNSEAFTDAEPLPDKLKTADITEIIYSMSEEIYSAMSIKNCTHKYYCLKHAVDLDMDRFDMEDPQAFLNPVNDTQKVLL